MRSWKKHPGKPQLNMLPGQDCPDPQHMLNLYPDGGTLQAVLVLAANGGTPDQATGPGNFGTLKAAGCP
jgi:hypothetical protein